MQDKVVQNEEIEGEGEEEEVQKPEAEEEAEQFNDSSNSKTPPQ